MPQKLNKSALVRRSGATDVSPAGASPELREAAEQYAQAARTSNTKKAYTTDFARFCDWCEQQDDPALSSD